MSDGTSLAAGPQRSAHPLAEADHCRRHGKSRAHTRKRRDAASRRSGADVRSAARCIAHAAASQICAHAFARFRTALCARANARASVKWTRSSGATHSSRRRRVSSTRRPPHPSRPATCPHSRPRASGEALAGPRAHACTLAL